MVQLNDPGAGAEKTQEPAAKLTAGSYIYRNQPAAQDLLRTLILSEKSLPVGNDF